MLTPIQSAWILRHTDLGFCLYQLSVTSKAQAAILVRIFRSQVPVVIENKNVILVNGSEINYAYCQRNGECAFNLTIHKSLIASSLSRGLPILN